MDKKRRTLTTFMQTCMYRDEMTGLNSIDDAVQPYTLEGPYGQIFDGDETRINDSRWVLFEMSELIQNPFNRLKSRPKVAELVDVLQWAYAIKKEEYVTDSLKIETCIVVHKDGCLQMSFGFRGNDLDSFSAQYVNSVSVYLNEAVKRLGDGWMVSIEAQRYRRCWYRYGQRLR